MGEDSKLIKEEINFFGKYVSCSSEDKGGMTTYFFDINSFSLSREMFRVDNAILVHYNMDGLSVYHIKDTTVKIAPGTMFEVDEKKTKSALSIYNENNLTRSEFISKLEEKL